MTEAEWLACVEPLEMLASLPRGASARKLRLFGCACCRRIWDLLPNELNRQAVLAVEECPDVPDKDVYPDIFDHPVLKKALAAFSTVAPKHSRYSASWAVRSLGLSYERCAPRDGVVAVVMHTNERATIEDSTRAEGAAQADLLRCIFGNPFQPATADADLLTPTLQSLAQAAYDERLTPGGELNPVLLSVLADALEEVAAAADEVASHLRSPGPHFRGCFAVDLLLAKE
jgi:hypothetical protein